MTGGSHGAIWVPPSAQRQRRGRTACAVAAGRRRHGFAALVDPAAGGRRLEALVGVTLAPGTESDDFATAASRLDSVTEVLHLTGAPTIS